jgi:hypothetical protein
VLAVPGLYGDLSKPVAAEDERLLIQKLDAYWAWVKADVYCAGMIVWHWANRGGHSRGASMDRGAGSYKGLATRLAQISNSSSYSATVLKTDESELPGVEAASAAGKFEVVAFHTSSYERSPGRHHRRHRRLQALNNAPSTALKTDGDHEDLVVHPFPIVTEILPPPPPQTVHLHDGDNQPWRQDRFAISMWVDPMVPKEQLAARYAEMREAGFTVVMAQAWASKLTNPDCGLNYSCQLGRLADAEAVVTLAEQAGLRVIMRAFSNLSAIAIAHNMTKKESFLAMPLPDPEVSLVKARRPSLWGYDLWDEPSGRQEFTKLAQWSASIATARPGSLRYINLLPNHATATQWGFDTYDEYVDAFIQSARPDVLCMDNYPHFELADSDPRHSGTRDDYRQNVATLRKRALQLQVPFWNFFNTLPFGRRRDPTFGELCWQVFTSLTYGAKGILWYIYWLPPGFEQGGSVITKRAPIQSTGARAPDAEVSFQKGPHYADAKRINSIVLAWAPYLLNATSTNVFHVRDTANRSDVAAVLREASIFTNISGEGVSPKDYMGTAGHFLVGEFALSNQRTAVMIHNQLPHVTSWPTLGLGDPSASLLEVDPIDGVARPLLDDSPGMPGLQLRFAEGMARLIVQSDKHGGRLKTDDTVSGEVGRPGPAQQSSAATAGDGPPIAEVGQVDGAGPAAVLPLAAPPRRPDPRFAANLTLYHIYQRNLSDVPLDMDLADVGGDLYYYLGDEVMHPLECRNTSASQVRSAPAFIAASPQKIMHGPTCIFWDNLKHLASWARRTAT